MRSRTATLSTSLVCVLLATSPLRAATSATTSEPPGCSIQRALDDCMEGTGNGYEQLQCLQPALRDARAELIGVHARIAPRLREDAALAAAFAAAETAWQAWIDRDCELVSQDWSGGSMRRAVVAACHYRHTIERAQRLWYRHEQAYEGQIADECVPRR